MLPGTCEKDGGFSDTSSPCLSNSSSLPCLETAATSALSCTSCTVLAIGDMHFADRSLAILPLVCHQLLEWISKICPDHVVHLGDFLDRFGNINSKRLVEATTFLGQASDLCPSIAVIGNHDIPKKRAFLSPNHGFSALHRWNPARMRVADTKAIEFCVKGFWFRAVPYCPNGRLWEALSPINERKYSATFCHQELKGHHMEHLTGATGDPWPLGSGLAVAGHLHEHRFLPASASHDEILYTGSPYQDNYTESPDKSISLLTFNSDGSWKEDRIFLDLPKKIKLCMLTSQYALWEPLPNTIYTLILSGGSAENAQQSASEKSKQIRASGTVTFVHSDTEVNMESQNTEPSPNIVPVAAKSLQQELADIIAKDRPYLWGSYLRVFSNEA